MAKGVSKARLIAATRNSQAIERVQRQKDNPNESGKADTAEEQVQPTLEKLPSIDVNSFRKLDPLYETLLGGSRHANDDESSNEYSTEGYLMAIPFAPGSEPSASLEDKKYPKLLASEFTVEKLKQHDQTPIIVFKSSNELRGFMIKFPFMKIPADKMDAICNDIDAFLATSTTAEVQLLPDGRIIFYSPDIEKRIKNDIAKRTAPVSTTHIKVGALCKYLALLLLGFVGLIFALNVTLSRLFPQYFDFGFGREKAKSPAELQGEYYKTLQLDFGADIDTIKRQYKTLAIKLHPDRNPGCVDCEAKFMKIADAYKRIVDLLEGGDGNPTVQKEPDYDREMTVRPLRFN